MITGKTIALTRWTFVDKVMSLLLNMLSRLVITFLPRSKRLLISWLQSPSAVILEPRKIKSATVSTSICYEVMGPDAMIFVFWMLSFKPTFTLLFHFHQEAFKFFQKNKQKDCFTRFPWESQIPRQYHQINSSGVSRFGRMKGTGCFARTLEP